MNPIAVICDIDGTLAHRVDRSPYDYAKVSEDVKDEFVHFAFAKLAENATRIIMSGREEWCRKDTESWLKDNGITYHHLYMRATGDQRSDTIVKLEMYERHVKGRYNVRCVLDDRNRVVEMWRDNGLKCLQVAEGDF